jgi:hypothetical protein
MKTTTLLITLSLVLCFSISLNAQHKLGLSYNPFVEKQHSSITFKPVSGALNYESKEFGRFAIRSGVNVNYYKYEPYFVFLNLITHNYENSNVSFVGPSNLGDLEYISKLNIGVSAETKFRLTNTGSKHEVYILGGFNANILYNVKWIYSNGPESNYPLYFGKFIYLKFGAGYSYKINQCLNFYTEPIVNYCGGIGIWQFGVNTGVMFNLGNY